MVNGVVVGYAVDDEKEEEPFYCEDAHLYLR